MNVQTLLTFLFLCYAPSSASRILVFLPIPFKSHILPFQSLVHELATRGHQVVEVSAFSPPRSHPNYHHHQIPPAYTAGSLNLIDGFRSKTGHALVRMFSDFLLDRAEEALQLAEVQDFIENDESKFDVVFVSATFGGEAFVSLGHKYNAPIINFQPLGYRPSTGYIVGGLLSPTTMVDFRQPHSAKMTFTERLANVYMFFADLYDMHFYYLPRVETLMKNYINYPAVKYCPDLRTLLSNISMTFIEYDPTLGIPYALPPNVHFTGGLQLRDAQPLPAKLESFVSEATHGVVYVSLGSLLQVSQLPKSTVDAFVDAFRRIKYRVIWKADVNIEVHENVLIDKWFPQTDIIGHPKCKVFITHGGIHSSMETGYLGVPVVMMPGFSDQFQNVKIMEEMGMGVILDFDSVKADDLVNAVEEVTTNPKYKASLDKISHSMKTAPMSSLEKAVKWTEFVAKNRGADYLRPESRDASIWSVLGADLILGISLVFVLVGLACAVVVKKLLAVVKRVKLKSE